MSVAASDSAAPAQQARTELADVFARYADGYFDTHWATQTQRKVARAIVRCIRGQPPLLAPIHRCRDRPRKPSFPYANAAIPYPARK